MSDRQSNLEINSLCQISLKMFYFFLKTAEVIFQFKETYRCVSSGGPAHLCVVEEADVVGAEIFMEQLEQSSIKGRHFDEVYDSDNSVQNNFGEAPYY